MVVVGGGFGGLQAVLRLRRAPVEITLVDQRNFHLFQPLTYQVATGALSPGEITYPLRAIFKRDQNVRVLMAEVRDFDLAARELLVHSADTIPALRPVQYDTLIVAGGSHYSYFGHQEWSEFAPEVKSLESALTLRSRILNAFETAEMEAAEEDRAAWLTFVIVGGGPTGVEMAGQIGELAGDTLRRDFRTIDTRTGRIVLVESASRLLTRFPPSLSERAARSLRELGVTPMVDSTVVGIDAHGVTIDGSDGERKRVPARTVVWAAGVAASGLAARLGELTGAEVDKAGRVSVEPDLTLPGHPEVFAIGDMVRVRGPDGTVVPLPGVAPVAMQQGRYAAEVVRARLRSTGHPRFRYLDKGNLATIGRGAAVADLKRVRLSGLIAWVIWLVVHLWYLIGFENRLLVLTQWSFSFVTHGRGARIISDQIANPDRPDPIANPDHLRPDSESRPTRSTQRDAGH